MLTVVLDYPPPPPQSFIIKFPNAHVNSANVIGLAMGTDFLRSCTSGGGVLHSHLSVRLSPSSLSSFTVLRNG